MRADVVTDSITFVVDTADTVTYSVTDTVTDTDGYMRGHCAPWAGKDRAGAVAGRPGRMVTQHSQDEVTDPKRLRIKFAGGVDEVG